ncbi:MAG: outer membrane beta-barrel protein [Aquabacterium sp.]
MKKVLFAGVIALACGMAQAQSNSPLYIGGTIGQSKISVDFPGFDETDTGYKIYGGYQINPNFALELGYANFGEASHSFPAKFEADAFYGAGCGPH